MRRILSAFLWCWLWAMAASGAHAKDAWTQFRGPQGDGHAQVDELPVQWSEQRNIVWKTPIHGQGWSSPVVWGEQIWLTTATEDGKQLFGVCVDLKSGKTLHDIRVFDVEKPRFKHKLNSYASPTPVIEQGRVYLHFGSYGTACLDTATGKRLWQRRDLPCNHFRGPGSSPVLVDDRLVVHYDGFDHQYVVALDKHTGRTIWRADRTHDFGTTNGDFKKAYSTPLLITVDGRRQLISPASKAVYAYDPRTGKSLWRVRFKDFSSTVMPLFDEGLLLINTGFGKAQMLAVRPDGVGDVTETHVVWREKRSVPSKPTPVVVDHRVYMVHDQGVATCLDVKSGRRVWSHRLGGNFSSSPLAAAGRIYFFNHEGKSFVVKPGVKFDLVAENLLDAGCMASPAAVHNALVVRTKTHLYRIENR